MPFKIVEEQKAFTFTLVNGLPVATVERWGKGLWVLCCPLCGCIHDCSAQQKQIADGGAYEPVCLLKRTHPAAYRRWVSRFPESAQYTRIRLKLPGGMIVPLGDDIAPGKVAA